MGITTSLYEFDGASRSLLLLLHTLEVCAIQEEKKLMLKSDKQPMCAFLNTIVHTVCMYVGCTHSLTRLACSLSLRYIEEPKVPSDHQLTTLYVDFEHLISVL